MRALTEDDLQRASGHARDSPTGVVLDDLLAHCALCRFIRLCGGEGVVLVRPGMWREPMRAADFFKNRGV